MEAATKLQDPVINHLDMIAKKGSDHYKKLSIDEHKAVINGVKEDYYDFKDDVYADSYDHILIEENHETVLNYFQEIISNNDHETAHMFAQRLIRECNHLLEKEEHKEKHYHIHKIKTSIQNIHKNVKDSLKNKMINVSFEVNQKEILKVKSFVMKEMLGAVCHNINQPLQALSGYAELLLMKKDLNEDAIYLINKFSENICKMGNRTKKYMLLNTYGTKTDNGKDVFDIDSSVEGYDDRIDKPKSYDIVDPRFIKIPLIKEVSSAVYKDINPILSMAEHIFNAFSPIVKNNNITKISNSLEETRNILEKIKKVDNYVLTNYLGGIKIIDIDKATKKDQEEVIVNEEKKANVMEVYN